MILHAGDEVVVHSDARAHALPAAVYIHRYSLHIWLTFRQPGGLGDRPKKMCENANKTDGKMQKNFALKKRAAWLPDFALFAQFPKRKTPTYKPLLRCPKNEKSMEIRR